MSYQKNQRNQAHQLIIQRTIQHLTIKAILILHIHNQINGVEITIMTTINGVEATIILQAMEITNTEVMGIHIKVYNIKYPKIYFTRGIKIKPEKSRKKK